MVISLKEDYGMFIVQIMGGLGNQLFQRNFADYLKQRFPLAEIRFNLSYFKKDARHGGYLLEKVPYKYTKLSSRGMTLITDDNFFEEILSVSDNDDVYFRGYWQNPAFFVKKLSYTDLFSDVTDFENLKIASEIDTSESVSVHVRCGDYNNHFLFGNISTKAYYNNAINIVAEKLQNPVFFVFSNDLEWAKNNLRFGDKTVKFIDINNSKNGSIKDLYLMSLCKHNIISNSSFSWWAQQLNKNEKKQIYLPPYWINEKRTYFNTAETPLYKINNSLRVSNIPCNQNECNCPFFSVIISCYNQPYEIRRAVSSVLNQTSHDFEVIVVDDGSTDNSMSMLEEFLGINKRVRIIKLGENKGKIVVKKTGVSVAEGKYVLFLDGDDYYVPDALEKLQNEIKSRENIEVLAFAYIKQPLGNVIFPEDDVKKQYNSRLEQYLNQSPSVFTLWNKVYSCELLKKVFTSLPDFYLRRADDCFLGTCISAFTEKYEICNLICLNYIDGIGDSTCNHDIIFFERFIESIRTIGIQLESFFSKCTDEKAHLVALSIQRKLLNDYLYKCSIVKTSVAASAIALMIKTLNEEVYLDKMFIPKLERIIYTPNHFSIFHFLGMMGNYCFLWFKVVLKKMKIDRIIKLIFRWR